MDVSIVINLHREGRLAWRSIRSAHAAAEYARKRGIEVYVFAVLDRPDMETRFLAVKAYEAGMLGAFTEVNHGDLGLARNVGVERTSNIGKYITFLDGDDLTSETWIARAYLAARANPGLAVFHRQFVIQFGNGDNLLWEQPDSDNVNPEWLITESFWCSQPFAPREVFEQILYNAVSPGFCFEDWEWNCNVLARGIRHRIVKDEPIFVRRKPVAESLGQLGYAVHALAPATELFAHVATNPQRPRLEAPGELPEHTREQWGKIHAIEPECYPREIESWHKECRNLDGAYDQVLEGYGEPEVVIACNWVKAGGADEAMLFHLRAHREAGKKVTLLVTGPDSSPWLHKAEELGARICHLHALTPDLDDRVRASVLSRVLVQRPPEVLSVHNSDLVWRMLMDNPKAYTKSTKAYVTAYCPDISEDGHLTSGGFAALDKIHDHIAGCFFDGHAFRDELLEMYAYDPKKLIVVDYPCERKVRRRAMRNGRLKVLWAARVDRQKQPELAFEIAAICAKEGLPIDFEVWGTGYHDGVQPTQFDLLTNAKYCGPFDGFASLPLERYDAYLYTSKWDGMPNSVLAACGAGLAVVAPEVGCLPELKYCNHITDYRSAEDFVFALGEYAKDTKHLRWGQEFAEEAVADRTFDRFFEQLAKVHGFRNRYFPMKLDAETIEAIRARPGDIVNFEVGEMRRMKFNEDGSLRDATPEEIAAEDAAPKRTVVVTKVDHEAGTLTLSAAEANE